MGVWAFWDCKKLAVCWFFIAMASSFWRGVFMAVGGVLSITGLTAVNEGAWVFAALDSPVEVEADSAWGGPKGREGAAVSGVIPTPADGTGGFRLPSKFHKKKLRVPLSPINGEVCGCFPTEVNVIGKPCETRELPLRWSNNLLIGKHLYRPLGKRSEKNSTIHSKGR